MNTKYTSEQYIRREALLETIRKRAARKGSTVRGLDRAELILAALNDLAERLGTDTETAAAPSSPFQVVVYTCKVCGAAEVRTDRGAKPVSADLVQCDAIIQETGLPNRATIPPKKRREALIRAGHRCEAPGCERTRFLEVHHKRARSQGGGYETTNLQVLCSGCHQLAHRRGRLQPILHQHELRR